MSHDILPLKILYAEDEQLMRESVTTILKRRIKTVIPSENGKIALELFKEHSPDMLITDLQMPVMDGMTLAKKIHEIAPNFPIVVISAYNDDTHRVPDAMVTLTKPITKQALLDAILKCSGLSQT